ncbi:MAG TPA: hypothetical protein VJN39_03770 [Gemmatimonadales bacterium]|nr:hypothetical protein [Gemmatimonadales bacterium]
MKTVIALLVLSLLVRATSAQSRPRPADLVPRDDTSFDANGLALNPIWGWQRAGRRSGDIDRLCGFVAGLGERSERPLHFKHIGCTSQDSLIVLNERYKTVAAGYACNQDTDEGELQGHVNWYVVTMTGMVDWVSYERGEDGQDHDVTLQLDTLRDIRDTLSTERRTRDEQEIEVEFNGDEVLGWAKDSLPPWWGRLWRSAQKSDAVPDSMIELAPAIVTGVFGLDAIHGAHPEIHPVYALALLVNQQTDGDSTQEHWAFFVRNGGNEGECSNGFMPFQDLSSDSTGRLVFRFTLPWRPGAGDVVARWRPGSAGVIAPAGTAAGPWLRQQRSRGVQMTFSIPRPQKGSNPTVIVGEFDLVWRGAGIAAQPRLALAARAGARAVPPRRQRERELEPGQQYQARIARKSAVERAAAVQALVAERDSNTFTPSRRGRAGIVVPPHDVALTAAAVVQEGRREPAWVRVWRSTEREPSPPPLPCIRSIPGCMSDARHGVGAGTILTGPGGGFVGRLILGETKTLLFPSSFGPFPFYSIRFAVGFDRIHAPLTQDPQGMWLVNPSAAVIVRLPSWWSWLGPYAMAGLDAYIGVEGAAGASFGGGVRLRSGLPALPFVEVRRAVRFGRPDYWAWESGLLAPLF